MQASPVNRPPSRAAQGYFQHLEGEIPGVMSPADQTAQVAPDGIATGPLSVDLDLAPVGTPYHFRKLHGDPRIVLSTRHEHLTHWLAAVIWAAFCLGLAAVAIYALRRSDLMTWLNRGWPWLAAVAGIAWLFLLPAGVLGLIVFVIALCVLFSRASQQTADGPNREGEP